MAGTTDTTAATPAPAEATDLVPPRFWWLKRIALSLAVFVAVLVGARLIWGVWADRRFQAAIDKHAAAGEPIHPQDFEKPPIRDEENAARFLEQAHISFNVPADSIYPDEILDNPDLLVERADDARELLEANARTFELLRQAREAPDARWHIPVRDFASAYPAFQHSTDRTLSKLLCAAARNSHHLGDDAAAVEYIHDTLGIGRCLRQQPFAIPHLVATAIDALGIEIMRSSLPDLAIGPAGEQAALTSGPASREQVDGLINDLLNEEARRDAWRWRQYTERASWVNTFQSIREGKAGAITIPASLAVNPRLDLLPEPVLGAVFWPMWEADAPRLLDHYSAVAEAGAARNYPAAIRITPAAHTDTGIKAFARLVSNSPIEILHKGLEIYFRHTAQRRMAAIALALRLYEVDHGHRADTLDELVPDYLAAIPADPFAADERPIGYRPDAPRPLLYSVSLNGIDEDGAYDCKPSGYPVWSAKDLPFFLDGKKNQNTTITRPADSASAQNGDCNSNGHDDDRSSPGDEREQQ